MTSMNAIFLDKDDAGGGGIPTRDQARLEDTWDLTLLYATPQDWQAAFEKLQSSYGKVEQWKGRVAESAQILRDVLEFDKALSLEIERLGHYASLESSGDSSNSENLKREALFENLLTRIGEATAYVSPEIQALDDATFERYLAEETLAPWRISLRKQRRFKPHTLSANEERLLALGHSALRGHGETFSQLTNVDMKFGVVADEKGVERELSQSSFSSFLNKRDPEVRRNAFKRFYAEIDDHKFTLASTLASSIKADVFHARARNYPSAREAALFSDDMPESVYDNLIATVRANLPSLHRYYDVRRRLLGLGEIHHYDTYVPIVDKMETGKSSPLWPRSAPNTWRRSGWASAGGGAIATKTRASAAARSVRPVIEIRRSS